jgi:hypothetical protein
VPDAVRRYFRVISDPKRLNNGSDLPKNFAATGGPAHTESIQKLDLPKEAVAA